jgi:hypothetical protein
MPIKENTVMVKVASWPVRMRLLLAAAVCGVLLAAPGLVPSARADFGLVPGSFTSDALRADGVTAETQAGIHPAQASTDFQITLADGPDLAVSGYTKNLQIKLPPGFVGNPEAVAKCSRDDFDGMIAERGACPADSQVGIAEIWDIVEGAEQGPSIQPVYNVVAQTGQAADFGIPFISVPTHIVASVDSADSYRVKVDVTKLSQGVPLRRSKVTLWGVPADPSHDALRACGTGYTGSGYCPPTGARKPFLTNPSQCDGPSTSTLSLDSWQNPGVFLSAAYTPAAKIEGCERLRFTPSADVTPTTTVADAPSGLSVDLTFPQDEDPDGLGTPPLRTARVTLPAGMTINPASAGGLDACTDAQLGLKTDNPIGCPDGSKIGTVTAETPLLAKPLTGSVYLRTQNSGDPGSGEMFRMALVLSQPERGLLIKLPGAVKVDESTGRITTEFTDNPQLPVSHIKLMLKSGPRAPLATPPSCGTTAVQMALSSWGGQSADLSSPIGIDCRAGLGGFAPSLAAGTAAPVGGGRSPFNLSISKPDGNAAINGLSMVLPSGLVAQLKGNLNSQVGTVKAFAGPGSEPFMLPGQVFLEGAYGDAPFSLRVVVPAKAGPFDLGTVTVRQKIYVDPIDAQVTVVSDPVPTIVKGVPVRLQRLEVSVDKPGFMINPTSCSPKKISGVLRADSGWSAPIENRFQVGGCGDLDLNPELGLMLSGKGQTTDGKHPAITASLTQKPGQSNLKRVRVALPLSLALDVDNANGLCEFVDGSKVTPTCPKASIVGSVTATTPILDEPMSGPVYFVKNVRKDPKSGRDIRTLPKLVIPLTGQNGVKLTLTGTSDVENDQLVTTFDNIPDAPVSSFKLSINGGKGGILAVSGADICKATQIAEQQVDGQNSKQADADVYIQTPSCPLKVVSKKVDKSSVAVKVGGLGAGKVTVAGHGIKKTTRTITKSTVATITAKRTKGKPGTVTVSYDPAGPAKTRRITR